MSCGGALMCYNQSRMLSVSYVIVGAKNYLAKFNKGSNCDVYQASFGSDNYKIKQTIQSCTADGTAAGGEDYFAAPVGRGEPHLCDDGRYCRTQFGDE